jgi:hypothetical protein
VRRSEGSRVRSWVGQSTGKEERQHKACVCATHNDSRIFSLNASISISERVSSCLMEDRRLSLH